MTTFGVCVLMCLWHTWRIEKDGVLVASGMAMDERTAREEAAEYGK